MDIKKISFINYLTEKERIKYLMNAYYTANPSVQVLKKEVNSVIDADYDKNAPFFYFRPPFDNSNKYLEWNEWVDAWLPGPLALKIGNEFEKAKEVDLEELSHSCKISVVNLGLINYKDLNNKIWDNRWKVYNVLKTEKLKFYSSKEEKDKENKKLKLWLKFFYLLELKDWMVTTIQNKKDYIAQCIASQKKFKEKVDQKWEKEEEKRKARLEAQKEKRRKKDPSWFHVCTSTPSNLDTHNFDLVNYENISKRKSSNIKKLTKKELFPLITKHFKISIPILNSIGLTNLDRLIEEQRQYAVNVDKETYKILSTTDLKEKLEAFYKEKKSKKNNQMIQSGSFLNVIDNSGAKNICCIKVPKGYRRRYASIGDVITASVKNIRKKRRSTTKVKKGDVVKALIVRTRAITKSKRDELVSFSHNSAILLTKQNKLIGTRIFGAVPKRLKYTKFLRITSMCAGVIK